MLWLLVWSHSRPPRGVVTNYKLAPCALIRRPGQRRLQHLMRSDRSCEPENFKKVGMVWPDWDSTALVARKQ